MSEANNELVNNLFKAIDERDLAMLDQTTQVIEIDRPGANPRALVSRTRGQGRW